MMNSNEFIETEAQLRDIQNQITYLKNDEYKLNDRYTKLLMKESEENVGRCFKKVKDNKVSYCKIINIDCPKFSEHGNMMFNKYQYPAIWFSYPYNKSKRPFFEDNIFSGAWGKGNNFMDEYNGVTYTEITNDEFMDRFYEVNSMWINNL